MKCEAKGIHLERRDDGKCDGQVEGRTSFDSQLNRQNCHCNHNITIASEVGIVRANLFLT